MNKKKILYYAIPVLLGVFMFGSNFLSTELFGVTFQNFTVWFILSFFSFICGWLINKTIGWVIGGRIVFAVTVASVIVSLILVSFFSDYFGINDLLTEKLILYSLRNIMLGAMGLFGMSVAEVFILQRNAEYDKVKSEENEKLIEDAKREADLILNEAKLNSEKLLLDSEKKPFVLSERKNKIKAQLREFIRVEKELINNYDK